MLRDEQTNGIIAPLLERIAGLERQLEQAKKERDAFEVLASEFLKLAAKLDPIGAAGFAAAIQAEVKP
jgi:hypothetical protein